MKIIRIKNLHHSNDEKTNSTNLNNIKKYIKNILNNDGIFNINDENKLSFKIKNETLINSLSIVPNVINYLNVYILRNFDLKIKFNLITKKYELVKNTDKKNLINYCSVCTPSIFNTIQFNNDCFSNYFLNIFNEYNCELFLGIIFYDENVFLNNELIDQNKNLMYFYCYNKNTYEIQNDIKFLELNKNLNYNFLNEVKNNETRFNISIY